MKNNYNPIGIFLGGIAFGFSLMAIPILWNDSRFPLEGFNLIAFIVICLLPFAGIYQLPKLPNK